MEALQIIVLAFVVEAVWETLKMVWQDGKVSIDKIGALGVGLAVALVYQQDVLAMLNITGGYHTVGSILTGILISRGGNYVHDLVERLTKGKPETEVINHNETK